MGQSRFKYKNKPTVVPNNEYNGPIYFTPQVHKKEPNSEPLLLNETGLEFANRSKYNGFNKFNNTQNYNQAGKNDRLFNTLQSNEYQNELDDNLNTTKYNLDSKKS